MVLDLMILELTIGRVVLYSIVAVLGFSILLVLSVALFGKSILKRFQFKFLREQYSTESLLILAVMDVIASFDPTLLLFGLAIAPLAAVLIFANEWFLRYNRKSTKFFVSLVSGILGGVVIALPSPIAGIIVAWLGIRSGRSRGR